MFNKRLTTQFASTAAGYFYDDTAINRDRT